MKIPDRETLTRWILTRDAPVFVQFAKYGACGAISTVILFAIAMTLSATVIPAFEGMTWKGEPITDEVRANHHFLNNLIAWPFANLAAYLLNIWLVFTPGRHSRWVEFGLFTAISALSFGAGLLAGPLLISWFGIPTVVAQFSLMFTSALVNYVCRKFLVFEK